MQKGVGKDAFLHVFLRILGKLLEWDQMHLFVLF